MSSPTCRNSWTSFAVNRVELPDRIIRWRVRLKRALGMVEAWLSVGLNGYLARFFDSPGRVKHFDRHDIAGGIVVEDHSRLVLIALGNGNIAEHYGQCIGLGVVIHFHALLQCLRL